MAGVKKRSGAKTYVVKAARGTKIEATELTTANTWYEIAAVGAASALPIGEVGAVFKSPDTGETQITLATGDEAYPLTLTRICKTEASFSVEEGSIDATDDCDKGFTSNILDGFKDISGNLNGLLRYNDETQELETVTIEILGQFINQVTDDGAGVYVETVAANEKLLLFICLNKDAAVGEIQNWFILPVIFTQLASGAGNKDIQKRDITWKKGEGYCSIYRRTVFADDVISE